MYNGHDFPVWDLKFAPLTSSLFASGGRDGFAYLWNTATLAPVRMFVGHAGDVEVRVVESGVRRPVVGGSRPSVSVHRLWRSTPTPTSSSLVPQIRRCACGSSKSGSTCLVVPWRSVVWRRSLLCRAPPPPPPPPPPRRGDPCLYVMSGHSAAITAVTVSPDGRYIASAARDMHVRLWDLHTHTLARVLLGHTQAIYSLAFSGESGALASASVDGIIRVWNVLTAVGRDDESLRAKRIAAQPMPAIGAARVKAMGSAPPSGDTAAAAASSAALVAVDADNDVDVDGEVGDEAADGGRGGNGAAAAADATAEAADAASRPQRGGKRRRASAGAGDVGEEGDDGEGSAPGAGAGAGAGAGVGAGVGAGAGAGAAAGSPADPSKRTKPSTTRVQGHVTTEYLSSTFVTKATRVVHASFTTTNLLAVCGVFTGEDTL